MPEILVAVLIISLIALWFLINAFFSFSGTWEREVKELTQLAEKERISLGQFGPFVVGRCELSGGYQTFSGLALGPKVWLKRRDYGVPLLIRHGFSREIAIDLEGQVLARLRLSLSGDRLDLIGYFIPYKVSFSHNPAKVLSITALEPQLRKYSKVQYLKNKVGQEAVAPVSE